MICHKCGMVLQETECCGHKCFEGATEIFLSEEGILFAKQAAHMAQECGSSSASDASHDSDSQKFNCEEVLICEVEKRPILYNFKLPLSSRTAPKRDAQWNEIYEALGGNISVSDIKKKWKNIRDRYIRCKADTTKGKRSGSATPADVKLYKYYNLLQFLNDTVESKPTISNIENTSEDSGVTEDASRKDNTPKKQKQKHHELEGLLIKELSTPAEPQTMDDVDGFCQLMGNHLRSIPQESRLQIQIELLQTLQKYKLNL